MMALYENALQRCVLLPAMTSLVTFNNTVKTQLVFFQAGFVSTSYQGRGRQGEEEGKATFWIDIYSSQYYIKYCLLM